jgi:hypothetical protein
MEILFFQMADPNCGIHLLKPQMKLRSLMDVIPPAIIMF